ncbi:MAG: glycosyltransferase [Candidatus Saelkia tenebricola]|nr:glycosyltransferase [Candidatus Saelkia tenebricola]
MKIFMIHPHDLFDLSEPWTIRIKSLAREFIKVNHSVKIAYFPLHLKDLKKQRFIWHNIEIIPMDRRRGINILFKNTVKLLREIKWADIVHFQKCFHYASIPAIIASWIQNKPIHYDWDDWETKIYFYGKPASPLIGIYMWILERALPKFVDSISCSSNRLIQLATNEYGVSPKRTTSAHVGADLTIFNPQNKNTLIREKYRLTGPIVLYLGQLHGAQYAELFIHAVSVVIQWYPTAMFFIVGGGYRLSELKSLALDLGLRDKIIFTGFIPHEETAKYIAAADVCAACFENNAITQSKSPLKLAEYLASGKAIVASNVGEVRNMVGGVGILVEPGNHLVFAGGINELLSQPALREKMAVLSRKRAEEKYNWPTTAENLLQIYEQVLKGYEFKKLRNNIHYQRKQSSTRGKV